ncbi:MAG TPA: hypothetical protein VFF29_01845 [Bacteroidota bacterium]|nr:hypothetical protein [Bacteroidota bacterium]
MKILKWASIAALIAFPFVLFLRRRRVGQSTTIIDDESNIFASELEE